MCVCERERERKSVREREREGERERRGGENNGKERNMDSNWRKYFLDCSMASERNK